jgi:hypothetical protein
MSLCAIVYGGFGGYALYCSPTVKRPTSLLLATFSLSGSIVSILGVVGEATGALNPIVLIIFLVILVTCFHLGLRLLDRRWVSASLSLFEAVESFGEITPAVVAENWKSPREFVRSIRLVFGHWPPFLFTWKLTSSSLDEFPLSHEVCLLWCRIVSLFPGESALFQWLTTQYSNMPPEPLRTAFLHEMMHLSGCRITETTTRIRRNLESIERNVAHIRRLHRRFWKNILQRSVVNFWADAKAIFAETDKVEFEFQHAIDMSPNNAELLEAYCKFLLTCKGDVVTYHALYPNLLKLDQGGIVRVDLALDSALGFLDHLKPAGDPVIQDAGCRTPRRTLEQSDPTSEQTRLALQHLIDNTRIASVLPNILLMLFGTIISAALFIVFTNYYTKTHCGRQLALDDFGSATSMVCYSSSLAAARACGVAFDAYDLGVVMEQYAPTLSQSVELPPWVFGTDGLRDALALTRRAFQVFSETIEIMNDPHMLSFVYTDITPTQLESFVMTFLMAVDEEAQTLSDATQYLLSPAYVQLSTQILGTLVMVRDSIHATRD